MTGAARPTVRRARAAEWPALGRLLGAAFQDDPVWMWVCPDPRRRSRHLGAMFAQVIRRQVLAGNAWYAGTGPDGQTATGAAVWAPPDEWKHSGREMVRLALPTLRAVGPRVLRERVSALGALEANHPRDPHWYLEIIGADPQRRGQGTDSALMAPMVERCDSEGVPAFLESSKRENLAFYHRFGFEVTGEIRLAPGAPSMWQMWRDPR